jgi:hypothetical protein
MHKCECKRSLHTAVSVLVTHDLPFSSRAIFTGFRSVFVLYENVYFSTTFNVSFVFFIWGFFFLLSFPLENNCTSMCGKYQDVGIYSVGSCVCLWNYGAMELAVQAWKYHSGEYGEHLYSVYTHTTILIHSCDVCVLFGDSLSEQVHILPCLDIHTVGSGKYQDVGIYSVGSCVCLWNYGAMELAVQAWKYHSGEYGEHLYSVYTHTTILIHSCDVCVLFGDSIISSLARNYQPKAHT